MLTNIFLVNITHRLKKSLIRQGQGFFEFFEKMLANMVNIYCF